MTNINLASGKKFLFPGACAPVYASGKFYLASPWQHMFFFFPSRKSGNAAVLVPERFWQSATSVIPAASSSLLSHRHGWQLASTVQHLPTLLGEPTAFNYSPRWGMIILSLPCTSTNAPGSAQFS